MKIRKTKKGFTIVELVIVIAVIGILAAILIPTFIGLTNRANEASDNALVKNLNTALKMEEQTAGHEKSVSMQGAIDDLKNQGYLLNQISSKSGKVLVWDQQENQFLLNDAENGPKDDVRYWRIANNDSEFNAFKGHYSVYAGEGWTSKQAFGFTYGFDAGEKNVIEEVRYSSTDTNEVVIRTNGDQIVLNVYAPNKDVQFYGFAKEVNVLAAAPNSLHVHGSINTLSVEKGHVQVEETGIVFNLAEVATEGASVTNNGYIAENESGATVEGNQPSDVYQIATLGQLESFRDAVNAGNDFADLTVKLTKDITLRDGWKPIGEGSRNIVDAGSQLKGNFFKGTFDGQNHIISNLTNKGFIPTQSRYDTDGTYAYGLFALVGSSSVIKNVTLKDVNINLEKGDSVAAFVGFCSGSTTLQYLTVENGSIKGVDGIGGILGRTYASENRGEAVTFTVKLENCKNNAAIEATRAAGGKAAGIVGMVGDISKAPYQGKIDLTIKTCVNTGAVKVSNEASSQAAGILGYVTNTRSFTDNQKTDSMYKFYNDCTNSGELDAGEHGLTFDLYDNNPASHVKVIPANN